MKRQKKKSEGDEAAPVFPDAEDDSTVQEHSDTDAGSKTGIDAIQALQIIAGGLAAVVLIWWILRVVLHIL